MNPLETKILPTDGKGELKWKSDLEYKIEEILSEIYGLPIPENQKRFMREIARWSVESCVPEEKMPDNEDVDLENMYIIGANFSRMLMLSKAKELGIISDNTQSQ